MQHYYGAKAIAARLGYKDPNRIVVLHKYYGLPVIKKRRPKSCQAVWYADEAMLLAWRLSQAQASARKLRGKD